MQVCITSQDVCSKGVKRFSLLYFKTVGRELLTEPTCFELLDLREIPSSP